MQTTSTAGDGTKLQVFRRALNNAVRFGPMHTHRTAPLSTLTALLSLSLLLSSAPAAAGQTPGAKTGAAAPMQRPSTALASLWRKRFAAQPEQAQQAFSTLPKQHSAQAKELPRPAAPPATDAVQAPHFNHADSPIESVETIEPVETTDVIAVAADGTSQGSGATATWYGEAWPQFDRIIDAYTARTSRKHTFNTLIAHRNRAGFAKAPFDTLFGFDQGGLKVGLGLRFGILDDLDIGVLRVNGTVEVFDTYDFDVRYQFLKQARFGIDMAIRVGISWFAVPASFKAMQKSPYNADASGPFVSLLIDRVIANRALLGLGVLYHQNSSGPNKSSQDSGASVALQLAGDVRLSEGFSLALEYTQPIAGYHQFNPDITFGPRFITNRHTFAIVLSNTQWFDAAGILTGNNRTTFNMWVLGFNITREL